VQLLDPLGPIFEIAGGDSRADVVKGTTIAMVTACRLARLLDSGAHGRRQIIARLERSAHALRREINKGAKFWQ
jgi:hypothetical protein